MADTSTAAEVDRWPTKVRYSVLGWLCLAAAIAYVHRQCIAVPATQIQDELGIDAEQMGWVMAAFFITYSLFQIPGGWLGDRWGTRRMLTLFALVWSAATAALGLGWNLASLLSARLVGGAGQAGAFPCCVRIIARWFPPSERAFPNGLLGSSMSIGAAISTSVVSFLLADLGLTWQEAFMWLALVGLAWAVGFWFWFRDDPAEHPQVNAAELAIIREGRESSGTGATPAVPWLVLLTSPLMLLICAQQFFRASAHVFYQSWFPTFLQKSRDVSMEDSGYLNSLALSGYVLGAMAGGALSDLLQRRTGSKRWSRQALALGSMAGSALCLLVAYFIDDPFQAVLVITQGMFFAGVSGPVGYSITIDTGGPHVATVFSTMNMCGNLGAAIGPVVVPWLVKHTGWDLVLLFFVGIYLAAGVCWALINPEKNLFPEEPSSRDPRGSTASIIDADQPERELETSADPASAKPPSEDTDAS